MPSHAQQNQRKLEIVEGVIALISPAEPATAAKIREYLKDGTPGYSPEMALYEAVDALRRFRNAA